MKRTVLTFGLISGAVAILTLMVTIHFIRAKELGTADVLGYSSMVLSALLVFFGIRSYRENAGAGRMTFGRGFAVGLLITVVACVCSVVGFEIIYFKLMPDIGEMFSACMVERLRASGGTPLQIEPNDNPAAKTFQKALFDQGVPLTSFAVDDVQREYERLRKLGVQFRKPPTRAGPVTVAVLEDTCGNLIQLVQQ